MKRIKDSRSALFIWNKFHFVCDIVSSCVGTTAETLYCICGVCLVCGCEWFNNDLYMYLQLWKAIVTSVSSIHHNDYANNSTRYHFYLVHAYKFRSSSSIEHWNEQEKKNNNIVGADASHQRWAERSSLATYIRIPHTIVDAVMMESGAVNVYAKRVDCMRGINIVRGVAVLLTTLFDCRFVRSINTNWIELKRMRAVCCGGWVAFCK